MADLTVILVKDSGRSHFTVYMVLDFMEHDLNGLIKAKVIQLGFWDFSSANCSASFVFFSLFLSFMPVSSDFPTKPSAPCLSVSLSL